MYGHFWRIKVVTIAVEETKIFEVVAPSSSRLLEALLRLKKYSTDTKSMISLNKTTIRWKTGEKKTPSINSPRKQNSKINF